MITILVDPVKHVRTTSKYSNELKFPCVCFVPFMCLLLRD